MITLLRTTSIDNKQLKSMCYANGTAGVSPSHPKGRDKDCPRL